MTTFTDVSAIEPGGFIKEGKIVAATPVPSLERLKTEACTLPELQAAIVHLIEQHNGSVANVARMISNGQIRSKDEANENAVYGLR